MAGHVITVGDARCDWFKCNPVKLIKVQGERGLKPLCTRSFFSRFRLSCRWPLAAEAKPLVPRVGDLFSPCVIFPQVSTLRRFQTFQKDRPLFLDRTNV